MQNFIKKKYLLVGAAIIAVLILGYFATTDSFKNIFGSSNKEEVTYKTTEEAENIFVRFDMEAYDKIQENLWEVASDEQLSELFRLSLAKAASTTPDNIVLATKDRAGVAKMLSENFIKLDNDDAKKKIAVDTLIVLTFNLRPNGRSGVFTLKDETALRDNVSNIDKSKDLYGDLGVGKEASENEIEKAYENKKQELASKGTPEAEQEIEKIDYAKKVLTDENSKILYDENKIEPTVFSRVIGRTFYLHFNKISPTTLQEFGNALISASTTPSLDSMIIDLRGNIGGSLDFAPYFLGLFLGQNQYAFDLFRRGEYETIRTPIPKIPDLSKYKETAILTDSITQSTAEVITVAFKRFNLGKIVGVNTRGWGTVENTYALDTKITEGEKYSLFLVNSITLREDGEPIEGRGVDPNVNTSDGGWKTELYNNFNSQGLVSAIIQSVESKPLVK
jgi:C-terminal processing protease CtpA/Prc